jgi:hypothetical protein
MGLLVSCASSGRGWDPVATRKQSIPTTGLPVQRIEFPFRDPLVEQGVFMNRNMGLVSIWEFAQMVSFCRSVGGSSSLLCFGGSTGPRLTKVRVWGFFRNMVSSTHAFSNTPCFHRREALRDLGLAGAGRFLGPHMPIPSLGPIGKCGVAWEYLIEPWMSV